MHGAILDEVPELDRARVRGTFARKKYFRDECPEEPSPRKYSPSRWHFRPPSPLAFGFRLLPPGAVSTYLRSVLGARGKVTGDVSRFKRSKIVVAAICG